MVKTERGFKQMYQVVEDSINITDLVITLSIRETRTGNVDTLYYFPKHPLHNGDYIEADYGSLVYAKGKNMFDDYYDWFYDGVRNIAKGLAS